MRRQVLSWKGPGHTVLAGRQVLPPCPRALGTAWPCLTCVPGAVCLASQRPVSTFMVKVKRTRTREEPRALSLLRAARTWQQLPG